MKGGLTPDADNQSHFGLVVFSGCFHGDLIPWLELGRDPEPRLGESFRSGSSGLTLLASNIYKTYVVKGSY